MFFFNRYTPSKTILPLECRGLQGEKVKEKENKKCENGEGRGKDRKGTEFNKTEEAD